MPGSMPCRAAWAEPPQSCRCSSSSCICHRHHSLQRCRCVLRQFLLLSLAPFSAELPGPKATLQREVHQVQGPSGTHLLRVSIESAWDDFAAVSR